jgi:GNAT superfamily N-acetyltransferase
MIRLAKPDDAIAVHCLLKQLKREARLPYGDYYERFCRLISCKDHCYFVKERGGVAVGLIGLTFCIEETLYGAKKCAWINSFIVEEGCRKRGIGTMLLEWAEQAAKEKGCEFVQLITLLEREDAQAFYEKHGFTKTSYRYKKVLS